MVFKNGFRVWVMKRKVEITHITDDLGNDVVEPLELDAEFAALCAVANAAEEHHKHCDLLPAKCPICRALAELEMIRQGQPKFRRH